MEQVMTFIRSHLSTTMLIYIGIALLLLIPVSYTHLRAHETS